MPFSQFTGDMKFLEPSYYFQQPSYVWNKQNLQNVWATKIQLSPKIKRKKGGNMPVFTHIPKQLHQPQLSLHRHAHLCQRQCPSSRISFRHDVTVTFWERILASNNAIILSPQGVCWAQWDLWGGGGNVYFAFMWKGIIQNRYSEQQVKIRFFIG